MKRVVRKRTATLCAVAALALVGAYGFKLWRAKVKYDEFVSPINGFIGGTSIQPFDESAKADLEMVRDTWFFVHSETGSSADVLQSLGLDDSVEGLKAFWTKPIPAFSFTDHQANAANLLRAVAYDVGFPLHDSMYASETTIFSLREDGEKGVAHVHENSPEGVVTILYSKAKPKTPRQSGGSGL